VPEAWRKKKAYHSMKPLSAWLDELMLWIEVVEGWVEHSTPVAFWISGFYFA
jgi:dynein heavy chain